MLRMGWVGRGVMMVRRWHGTRTDVAAARSGVHGGAGGRRGGDPARVTTGLMAVRAPGGCRSMQRGGRPPPGRASSLQRHHRPSQARASVCAAARLRLSMPGGRGQVCRLWQRGTAQIQGRWVPFQVEGAGHQGQRGETRPHHKFLRQPDTRTLRRSSWRWTCGVPRVAAPVAGTQDRARHAMHPGRRRSKEEDKSAGERESERPRRFRV